MRIRSIVLCMMMLGLPSIVIAQAPPPLPVREANADIDELLASVAARTEIEFLVSVNVPERIYVSQIATQDITYPLLLAILRNNGLASVEVEERINIVPERLARQLVTQIVQRDDPDIPDDLWVSRIIEVRDGAEPTNGPGRAAMLVPVLRPLLPQSAHFAAYPSSSSLIIVDRYANVRRITEMVNQLTR